jgi:hypothetical protein
VAATQKRTEESGPISKKRKIGELGQRLACPGCRLSNEILADWVHSRLRRRR